MIPVALELTSKYSKNLSFFLSMYLEILYEKNKFKSVLEKKGFKHERPFPALVIKTHSYNSPLYGGILK